MVLAKDPRIRSLVWAPVAVALAVDLAAVGLGAGHGAGLDAPAADVPAAVISVADSAADEPAAAASAGATAPASPALVQHLGRKAGNIEHEKIRSYRSAQFKIREARLRRAMIERAELAARSIRDLVMDGAPIDAAFARDLAQRQPSYRENIRYIDQNPIMRAGCELISLDVSLLSMGFDLPLTEIADRYLVSGGDVYNYYQGSPYVNGGGYPQSIVNAANGWLADHGGGSTRAYNLTGTSFEDLCSLVEMGYPVLVWTTEGMSTPSVGGSWYYPEHCVVMYGVDGDAVQVSDSLAGLVDRDRDRFGSIYTAAGSRAAVVLPVSAD